MNDLPFGFSSSNDDDDDRRKNDPAKNEGGAGNNPFFGFGGQSGGAGSGAFDPGQLGQMLSQLGQMFSGMGSSMTSGGTGPVNYQVATTLARQQIGNFSPVSAGESSATADAVRLAEVWLDDASAIPAGVTTTEAWTPVQWLEASVPTFKRLCDPMAQQISGSWAGGIPEEARQFAGPMMGMLDQMGGMAFGTQLGQGLGQLAKEVLTSTDIGLPLAPQGTAVLLPEAIAKFAEGLEVPQQEVIVFLAAREAAHVRLFTHIAWLRERLLATVEDYARGITIDFSGIEQAASEIDPAQLLSDPSKIEELMSAGTAFEQQTTPEQKAALARLETLLALIEGWVEQVVSQALSERIPSTAALTETMRRRRAGGGPAEQTFATLVGLQLRPRKVREAAGLWAKLREGSDIAARDSVWSHPDLMPDANDIDNPAAFIDRVISGGTSAFDDPIAELEKTLAAEAAAKKAQDIGDSPETDAPEAGSVGTGTTDSSTAEKPGDQKPDGNEPEDGSAGGS